MDKKIKLKVIPETETAMNYCDALEVELEEDVVKYLCKKFGFYEFDWYFIYPDTIKYWKNNSWNYIHLNEILEEMKKEREKGILKFVKW